MTSVAVVLVTRDSQAWIRQTLASIAAQTRRPDAIVVVDDHSSDDTRDIVAEAADGTATMLVSRTTAARRITRIAQNFEQGVRACREHDVVVLGDHDDVWLPDRVARQTALLEAAPGAVMVAGDGRLVDASGTPTGGTLRRYFPVPAGFGAMAPAEQMRVALRSLIATGGASAIRPASVADLNIPEGWLHDRWWSLVATAREGMLLDDAAAIDYRISAHQEVGLEQGSLNRSALGRLGAAVASLGPSTRKLADLRRELRPLATRATRPELEGTRLLSNLLRTPR